MARPKFLIILFDGLRPDLVRADTAPHLHAFRRAWCTLPNAAATFPSETRVQVSSFVTGNFSGRPARARAGDNRGDGHGIIANTFYDPALGFDGPMDTSDLARMNRADAAYGGRLLAADDLGAILHRAGLRYGVVTTGTIGNARLLNWAAAERGQPVFSIRGPEVSSPAACHAEIVARFGPVPKGTFPNVAVTDYATDILLNDFLARHDPDVAVLWLNEPDLSFHYRGIGSPESLEAIAAVDRAFGRIVDWWQTEGRAAGWQIVTASDHGQITATGQLSLLAKLREAGFAAAKAIGPDADVAVKPSYAGGITVRDRDPALIDRVFRWAVEQEWCGLVLSREPRDGALPMAALNVASGRAPDLWVALRTTDGPNAYGYPGTMLCDNPDIPEGGGMHGGLHRSELNTLLTLGGDVFRPATVVDSPCALTDMVPTMLAAFGLEVPGTVAGRPLRETFAGGPAAVDWREHVLRAGHGGYVQEVTVAEVDGGALHYLRGGRRVC
ncbi:MAG: alkaline phosphatase family protein [Alphaproteobacteria bacterium]